ncbi:hypothetical protein D3C80_1625300 [compost metagenome]
MCHRASAEFTKFVGCTDKYHVDGIDATTHLIRRPEGNQRFTNINRDHVGRPHHHQRTNGNPRSFRQTKHDSCNTKHRNTHKHQYTCMMANGIERQKGCNHDGPDAGCGTQKPQSPWAKCQHFLGKNRHQCNGAAEQYCKQVKRDRPKHNFFLRDEAEARQHAFQ